MKRKILVCGATGNQGGAVIRNLAKNPEFEILGLTRNPQSEKAKPLRTLRCQLVQGDLNVPSSMASHFEGLYGVFSVQTYEKGKEKEILHGKNIASLAKDANVQHFVYSSSSLTPKKNTGVPMAESKAEIERFIKELNLPYSFVRPSSFFENLLRPEVEKRIWKGQLVMPTSPEIKLEMVGVDDIGKVVRSIFENRDKHMFKEYDLATDYKSYIEIAEEMSDVLGMPIKAKKLPSIISRLVMGKDLYQMVKYINRNKPSMNIDINSLRNSFDGLSDSKQWIKIHFAQK